jgi:hypothetical protein
MSATKLLTAFGRFWKDFLIGDTPEIFVGVLVVLAVVVPFRHHPVVAAVALPVLVTVLLATSVVRGRRRG